MAEFNVWLLIVGIAVGALLTWLVVGTVARRDEDLAATERTLEAAWISRTIEEHGGRIPALLVDQVLDLHRRYLQGRVGGPLEPEEAGEDAGDGAGDATADGVTEGTRDEPAAEPSEAEPTRDEPAEQGA